MAKYFTIFLFSAILFGTNVDIKTNTELYENVYLSDISTDSIFGEMISYNNHGSFVKMASENISIDIENILWVKNIDPNKRRLKQVAGIFAGVLSGFYLGDYYARISEPPHTPIPGAPEWGYYVVHKNQGGQYRDYIKKVSVSVLLFTTIGSKVGKILSKYGNKIDFSNMKKENKRQTLKQMAQLI